MKALGLWIHLRQKRHLMKDYHHEMKIRAFGTMRTPSKSYFFPWCLFWWLIDIRLIWRPKCIAWKLFTWILNWWNKGRLSVGLMELSALGRLACQMGSKEQMMERKHWNFHPLHCNLEFKSLCSEVQVSELLRDMFLLQIYDIFILKFCILHLEQNIEIYPLWAEAFW